MESIIIESFKGVDQSYHGPFKGDSNQIYTKAYDWIDSRQRKLIDENHPYRDSFTHRVVLLQGV